MVRLRVLLAWIVMLAVPLQGLAAASMLFCGVPAGQTVAGHHHSAKADDEHRHGRDGAAHQHNASVALSDAIQIDSPDEVKQSAGAHKCSVCAACSHSIGITGPATLLSVATAPHSELAAVPEIMHSRSTRVDDKPPRS